MGIRTWKGVAGQEATPETRWLDGADNVFGFKTASWVIEILLALSSTLGETCLEGRVTSADEMSTRLKRISR